MYMYRHDVSSADINNNNNTYNIKTYKTYRVYTHQIQGNIKIILHISYNFVVQGKCY